MASRIRVLIVDDEQVVCDLLSEELTERGYLCTAVLSGQEALAKTKEEHFDLVLLDVRLPGMSGMEVLRKLSEERPSFPVIMITALNDASTAVEAMKLGAYDYIVKPFDLGQVESCMRRALKQRGAKSRTLDMEAIARHRRFSGQVAGRQELPIFSHRERRGCARTLLARAVPIL